MVLVIDELEQTCMACPSQWQGKLRNGHTIYVRYRWGYLSVRTSEEPTDNYDDAVRGIEIFGEQIGEGFDGFISTMTMLNRIQDVAIIGNENVL